MTTNLLREPPAGLATRPGQSAPQRTGTSAGPREPVGAVNYGGILPWSSFGWIDQLETVPELTWPNSIHTFNQMRNDSQVGGLYAGTCLPIRRFKWMVDAQDSDPAIAKMIAEDLNLPVKGDPSGYKKGRMKGRFNHDYFLRHALLALTYGHFFFEMEGEVRDSRWRMNRLSPRMPHTLTEINVERNGDLRSIKQATGPETPELEAGRLVPFAWDREGGNWLGRSLFRTMYKHWLIKDRLLRVDAIKHERNGMGIPFAKATQPDVVGTAAAREAQTIATKVKVGEEAGGFLPYGTDIELKGVQGNLPDTLASINYHDEAMARALLMMFMQLGQTKSGSRALGSEFINYFQLAQEAIAIWYIESLTEGFVDPWIDWNYGEDHEDRPVIVYEANDDPNLAVSDLVAMINAGLIVVDKELEEWIRGRHMMPDKQEGSPDPVPLFQRGGGAAGGGVQGPGGEGQPGTGDQNQPGERSSGDQPSPPNGGTPANPVSARRQQRTVTAAVEDTSPLMLPSRPLRRQPYTQEVQAQVNFAELESVYTTSLDHLVTAWTQVRDAQIQDLHDRIIDADGDLRALGDLATEVSGADHLISQMVVVANQGAQQAADEANRQGLNVSHPDTSSLRDSIAARAEAMDVLVRNSLADTASIHAVRLTGGSLTPAEVAGQVQSTLQSLSDSWLKDQFGGMLNQAMNAGRGLTFGSSQPSRIYASELLDNNTCTPCVGVDGTEYTSMDDAERDYPGGGFVSCSGGPRCRGTLVAVYDEVPAAV